MELVALYLAVYILVGLAACFFGKRLFFAVMGLLVFFGALSVGLGSGDGSTGSVVVALVLGVAAALLSKFVYRAGVFLVGFVAGVALGFFLAMMFLPQDATSYLGPIVLVAGLVVGTVAAMCSDVAVRLGTAYAGATFAASNLLAAVLSFGALTELAVPGDVEATFNALSTYVTGDFSAANATAVLVATIVLTVAGFMYQSKSEA